MGVLRNLSEGGGRLNFIISNQRGEGSESIGSKKKNLEIIDFPDLRGTPENASGPFPFFPSTLDSLDTFTWLSNGRTLFLVMIIVLTVFTFLFYFRSAPSLLVY